MADLLLALDKAESRGAVKALRMAANEETDNSAATERLLTLAHRIESGATTVSSWLRT